jgi:hypothetical protein
MNDDIRKLRSEMDRRFDQVDNRFDAMAEKS